MMAGRLDGQRLARLLLDAVLPPRCLACGAAVARQGGLCVACWTRLVFVAPPQCACCGIPFSFAVDPGARCPECLVTPPAFQCARAVFVYDAASRPLVTGFKFGDRIHAAEAYGQWLARAGQELLAEADGLVPVPLHWWRLFRRRYNQAALLAGALARISGVPLRLDGLCRHRPTSPQTGLLREKRQRNVRAAFAVPPQVRPQLVGARLILVDDVLTTGATANECARTLLDAGAQRVDVLTLARVTREE